MPPRDYAQLSDAEQDAALERQLATAPERLAAFRREAGELDGTSDSLVAVWQWFLRRNVDGGRAEEPAELPEWYEPDPPELAAQRLPPATLRDVDGVGLYLAEVFLHNVPGAAWGIGRLPEAHAATRTRTSPVVKLDGEQDVNPIGIVYGNAVRVALMGEATQPDTLLEAFRAWVPE